MLAAKCFSVTSLKMKVNTTPSWVYRSGVQYLFKIFFKANAAFYICILAIVWNYSEIIFHV